MKFKFCHIAVHCPEKNCIKTSYFFLETEQIFDMWHSLWSVPGIFCALSHLLSTMPIRCKYEYYLQFTGQEKSLERFADILVVTQRENCRAQVLIQISLIVIFVLFEWVRFAPCLDVWAHPDLWRSVGHLISASLFKILPFLISPFSFFFPAYSSSFSSSCLLLISSLSTTDTMANGCFLYLLQKWQVLMWEGWWKLGIPPWYLRYVFYFLFGKSHVGRFSPSSSLAYICLRHGLEVAGMRVEW